MPDSSIEQFRGMGHQLIEWIAAYLENPEQFPVLSKNRPGELLDALPASGPEQPEPLQWIVADFEKQVLPAVTHWNHPAFLAYFSTSSAPPGILAELLSAALNTNGILWKTSPAVTELEIVVLNWIRQWMALPEGYFGIIFDTASTSSLHALAAARQQAAPEIRTAGRSEKPLTLYCSDQAHSSIEKAAIALGIGQDQVRKIPADDEFRMRTGELEAAIERDIDSGFKPFCLVATIGTTSTTSIDPTPEIASIAEKHGIWLHVDTAYAGAAAIVPELRNSFEGMERADSIVLNPHKWLFTPVDCSVLYTRKPETLRAAFSLVPEYLQTFADPRMVNMMEYGIPLGRRFRALKLWFILRAYGREGLAALILDHTRMARELAEQIAADERFEITAPVVFSVVCFRFRGTDEQNARLLDWINAETGAYLSHTVLKDRYVLRIAIGNVGTSRELLSRLWTQIQELAARLA
jgi:aromatic-L-amino-acid decarboxylase